MLRTHCPECGPEWDKGKPFLLFAIRETVQQSLGFSPAELVFGPPFRGQLKLLRKQIIADSPPDVNVADYVSSFFESVSIMSAK